MLVNRILRVGVIGGTGRVAQIDITNLKQLQNDNRIQISQICSRFGKEKIKELYNLDNVEVVDQYEQVINNKDIDVIINCANTNLHFEINKLALQNNKHLYTHKPGCESIEQIKQLIDIHENQPVESKSKIGVCFQRRYSSNYISMREQIKNNKIGDIETLSLISRDKQSPSLQFMKENGGQRDSILVDFCIHDIDLVRFLSGLEFKQVYVQCKNLFTKELPDASDTALVSFEMRNQALGTILLGRRNTYGYDQRVEILGSEALIQVKNNARQDHLETWNSQGLIQNQGCQAFHDYYHAAFRNSLIHFIQSLNHSSINHKSSLQDIYQAFIVIQAMKTSLQTNTPINIVNIS